MHDEINRFPLDYPNELLSPERSLNEAPENASIRLRPGTLYGSAFPSVQQPELDARGVGGTTHHTIERVDLTDEVPLSKAPDRRVA